MSSGIMRLSRSNPAVQSAGCQTKRVETRFQRGRASLTGFNRFRVAAAGLNPPVGDNRPHLPKYINALSDKSYPQCSDRCPSSRRIFSAATGTTVPGPKIAAAPWA